MDLCNSVLEIIKIRCNYYLWAALANPPLRREIFKFFQYLDGKYDTCLAMMNHARSVAPYFHWPEDLATIRALSTMKNIDSPDITAVTAPCTDEQLGHYFASLADKYVARFIISDELPPPIRISPDIQGFGISDDQIRAYTCATLRARIARSYQSIADNFSCVKYEEQFSRNPALNSIQLEIHRECERGAGFFENLRLRVLNRGLAEIHALLQELKA